MMVCHVVLLYAGVDLPIAWENRDRQDSALVRRYATQPLRNWISQLQQKQLRAGKNILGLGLG